MFGAIIDWKFKLATVAIVLSALFFWHKYQVHSAINTAVTEVHQQYATEILKLKDQAQVVSAELQDKIDKQQKDKANEIKAIQRKHDADIAWLNSINRMRDNQTSSSGNTGNTDTNTGRPEDVIGELTRQNALDLAAYGADSEVIRQSLITCYADYATVKKTIDEFRTKHSKQ